MKDTKYITISASQAETSGVVPITTGYREEEYPLLDRAVESLGTKPHVLVRTREGIVIARPSSDVIK